MDEEWVRREILHASKALVMEEGEESRIVGEKGNATSGRDGERQFLKKGIFRKIGLATS